RSCDRRSGDVAGIQGYRVGSRGSRLDSRSYTGWGRGWTAAPTRGSSGVGAAVQPRPTTAAWHAPCSRAPMIGWLQWPALVATLTAAWLVASQRRGRRLAGFVTLVVSNVLWVIWAIPAHAYALVVLQVGLFLLNLRGVRNNEPAQSESAARGEPAAPGAGT